MESVTRNFTVEELEEFYDLPYDALSDEEFDKRRWYTIRELVFRADDGHYYMVYYMDPATEMQEDQDRWEDSRGYVEATRVVPEEITTIRWVAL